MLMVNLELKLILDFLDYKGFIITRMRKRKVFKAFDSNQETTKELLLLTTIALLPTLYLTKAPGNLKLALMPTLTL